MVVIRNQVSLSTFLEWEDDEFAPNERRPKELSTLLDTLVDTCGRLES